MNWSLQISRNELQTAIASLALLHDAPRSVSATLEWEDGHLLIRAPGLQCSALASGEWPGRVTVGLAFLLGFLKTGLPGGDPIQLKVTGGKFRVGTAVAACTTDEKRTNRIELPLDPPLLDLLRVPGRYTAAEIEEAGLTAWIEKAQKARASAVLAAAKVLEPLGLTVEQLEGLVTAILNDESRPLPSAARRPFVGTDDL